MKTSQFLVLLGTIYVAPHFSGGAGLALGALFVLLGAAVELLS